MGGEVAQIGDPVRIGDPGPDPARIGDASPDRRSRPDQRSRADQKYCNLRCGRTRRRQLAPTNAAVLGAVNLMGSARTHPECKQKQRFFHASEEDRRGPVGDVRLARAVEWIHSYIERLADLTRRMQRGGLEVSR